MRFRESSGDSTRPVSQPFSNDPLGFRYRLRARLLAGLIDAPPYVLVASQI